MSFHHPSTQDLIAKGNRPVRKLALYFISGKCPQSSAFSYRDLLKQHFHVRHHQWFTGIEDNDDVARVLREYSEKVDHLFVFVHGFKHIDWSGTLQAHWQAHCKGTMCTALFADGRALDTNRNLQVFVADHGRLLTTTTASADNSTGRQSGEGHLVMLSAPEPAVHKTLAAYSYRRHFGQLLKAIPGSSLALSQTCPKPQHLFFGFLA